MDITSLILTLVLVVLFLVTMYTGYQKFVIEGGSAEIQMAAETPSPTTLSVSPPSSEVPGVDSRRGRPLGAALSGQTLHYYAGGNNGQEIAYIIPKGQAKSASMCYEASKARGVNNWAWDRKDKACFAYTDSLLFSVFNNNNLIEDTSRYVVGCTEPDVTVTQGCTDFKKGDLVRSQLSGKYTPFSDATNGVTIEDCRTYARSQGYDAFVYESDRWSGPKCYYYADAENLRGWTGNNTDFDFVSGCTDTTKKVVNACQ